MTGIGHVSPCEVSLCLSSIKPGHPPQLISGSARTSPAYKFTPTERGGIRRHKQVFSRREVVVFGEAFDLALTRSP